MDDTRIRVSSGAIFFPVNFSEKIDDEVLEGLVELLCANREITFVTRNNEPLFGEDGIIVCVSDRYLRGLSMLRGSVTLEADRYINQHAR